MWNGVLSPGFSVDPDLLLLAARHALDDLLDQEIRPGGAVVLGSGGSAGEQQRGYGDKC